jgi:hypothetical protein
VKGFEFASRRANNMMARSSLCAVLVLGLLHVCGGYFTATSSLPADSKCEKDCKTCKGEFYDINPDGSCGNRTDYIPAFYTVDITCHYPDDSMKIKDPKSCAQVATRSFSEQSDISLHRLGEVATYWSPPNGAEDTSNGCYIEASNPKILPVEKLRVGICFGIHRKGPAWISQICAIVLGVFLGWLASRSQKHAFKGFSENPDLKYHSGAKSVATDTLVDDCRKRYILLYRLCQILTNLFFPATLGWYYGPFVIGPAYILLYVIPAFCHCGVTVFQNPQYFVTPKFTSFYGISYGEDTRRWIFPLSICRPFLLVAACSGLANLILHVSLAHGYTADDVGFWLINPSGYFKGAIMNPEGRFSMQFVQIVTALGVVGHILMTICPAYKFFMARPYDGELVTYTTDEDLRQQVHSLTRRITKAAAEDEEDDQDRVNEIDVDGEGGELEVMSKNCAYFGIALALIDFISYIYKVYVFLKDSRYFLAAAMTLACVEAVTSLVIYGSFSNVGAIIKRTADTGIPTIRYLSLIKWDDATCGVPSLLLTVYGLPLARPSGWLYALSNVFFICTGTRAMAKFLEGSVDSCMYEWAELDPASASMKQELKAYAEMGNGESDVE